MKNMTRKIAAVTFVTMASLSSVMTSPANAFSGDVVRLQSEGFRACKEVGRNGYTGLVDGTLLDGGSFNSQAFQPFRVRYCFDSRSECRRFVSNIERIVKGVNTIRFRSCKSRA